MKRIVERLKSRKLPDAVKAVLTSSDRVFEFLEVAEDRFLVVTMQALTEVESGQVKSRFGWDEVSHVRWDSEAGTLRIVFHEGEDLVITPIESCVTITAIYVYIRRYLVSKTLMTSSICVR